MRRKQWEWFEGVMDVSGALRNLRKQLEFLRGQVDWVIKHLEASLESIGSERISSLKQTLPKAPLLKHKPKTAVVGPIQIWEKEE